MFDAAVKPNLNNQDAIDIAIEFFQLGSAAKELPSERDQNFLLEDPSGARFVLKIANENEEAATLELQNIALSHLNEEVPWIPVPKIIKSVLGNLIEICEKNGRNHQVRLFKYLEGKPLADQRQAVPLIANDLGLWLGQIDTALAQLKHPAAYRSLPWNVRQAEQLLSQYSSRIEQPKERQTIELFMARFESLVFPYLHGLRSGLIYNDANDYNVLVEIGGNGTPIISGLLDFGDMVYGPYIYEAAVAAAYIMLDQGEPLAAADKILKGYHRSFPLREHEIDMLFDLVALRLVTSIVVAAVQQKASPDNKYLSISQNSIWRLLHKLADIEPKAATQRFRAACDYPRDKGLSTVAPQKLIKIREKVLGPSLSLAYQSPLKIVRGYRQYLYDDRGRKYLDMVNNVAHVGHCHPKVVRAGQRQMAVLNTNTRYLHDDIVQYGQRLIDLMPSPLSVCYFVCSGSEANELALRMAMTHTSRRGIMVVDGAYHGNTTTLVNISPYKYKGPGGHGRSETVFEVPLPDVYRGLHRGTDDRVGSQYVDYVKQQLVKSSYEGYPTAAFIVESLPGCAGQIHLPDGYLKAAFKAVRQAGGLCIADEVQVGFGRVGTHFWGFETQEVVPDIVTLGKPMGNGHPLAAVITTPEIAESFANGMEYFNTFGGNPVSAAIGLAVLDVIDEESLQANANRVGGHLLSRLLKLKQNYPLIGDVRGSGLFVGIELVADIDSLTPAADQARKIVEEMKERGILLSTDGPYNNVIKIKPPIVIEMHDADRMAVELENVLELFKY